MKIALGSDERTAVTDAVTDDLYRRGHEVVPVGLGGHDLEGAVPSSGTGEHHAADWVDVGHAVGRLVAAGDVDFGVLFCWTGTGASIAANKVAGVRAALCADAPTAAGARRWNDANVLVMSLRLTTPPLAAEMLDAWFATGADPAEASAVSRLEPGDR